MSDNKKVWLFICVLSAIEGMLMWIMCLGGEASLDYYFPVVGGILMPLLSIYSYIQFKNSK